MDNWTFHDMFIDILTLAIEICNLRKTLCISLAVV